MYQCPGSRNKTHGSVMPKTIYGFFILFLTQYSNFQIFGNNVWVIKEILHILIATSAISHFNSFRILASAPSGPSDLLPLRVFFVGLFVVFFF